MISKMIQQKKEIKPYFKRALNKSFQETAQQKVVG